MKHLVLVMTIGVLVGCGREELPEPQWQPSQEELALQAEWRHLRERQRQHNPMNDKRLHWVFKNNQIFSSAPAIGPDGTVYIGSWDKKLYAIVG